MKGIMFSGEMAAAIGNVVVGEWPQSSIFPDRPGKWITSRVFNPQPEFGDSEIVEMCNTTPEGWQTEGRSYRWTDGADSGAQIWKPRYLPGEVVYVKETWQALKPKEYPAPEPATLLPGSKNPGLVVMAYKAYEKERQEEYGGIEFEGPWRSAMLMPAWAARYHIKIVDVIAMRIRDTRYNEVIGEGVSVPKNTDRLKAFRDLWNKLNSKPKPVRRKNKIHYYVSFPWCEEDRDERDQIDRYIHNCYPNPWVFRYCFSRAK